MGIQYFGSCGANGIPLCFIQYSSSPEIDMHHAHLAFTYRPSTLRVPQWARHCRVWL